MSKRKHTKSRAWVLASGGTAPTQLSLTGSASLTIEASADGEAPKRPTFEIDAYNGGALRLAGWYRPVVVDLAGLRAGAQTTVLLDHDRAQIVGQGKATITPKGITVSGVITGDYSDKSEPAGKVTLHAKGGFAWAASIGASVDRVESIEAGAKVTVNGQEFSGPLAVVRAGRLGEVSFVGVGADETASAKVAATAAGGMDMDFSAWLKAKGIDEGGLSDAAKAALKASYDLLQITPEPKPTQKVTAEMPSLDAQIAERQRKQDIEALAAKYGEGVDVDTLRRLREIASECIEAKLTVQQSELRMLRETRSVVAAVGRCGVGQPPSNAVLAASMLLALGVDDNKLAKDRDFGDSVVEAAWKQRKTSIHGLIASALAADGIHAPHGGDELFHAAVNHSVKAGFSTVDLSGILGTVGNKLLLNSFTAIDATYERIAQQADFNNFLTYTQYRLDQTGEFAQVAPDGEIKHGKLSETSYTNKLETSGMMLTLTRQQIVNDDMNALNQLFGTLGKSARIAVEEALYGKIMEASDVFYTSVRGNKLTSNPLGVDGLAEAEAAMLCLVDANGKPIYAQPSILLVPAALKFRAMQLYTSATVNEAATAGSPQGVDNPYQGKFRVETSPFLSLATMAGYSATGWYLLADPNLMPAFQVAYLSGKRQPTIETADASLNTLGMQMRCFFDFGVAQVDYRGAISSDA